jgi:hypothetical protein
MNLKPTIEELAITLSAKNLNPTLLTPEFLAYSGIVPSEWSLASQPILNSQVAHIAFTNGINLSTELGVITISENLKNKTSQEVLIAEIARKYTSTLPNASYQAISINPSVFLTFEDSSENSAQHYISTHLLVPGSWQQVGTKPLRASVHLAYTLEHCQFNLKIDDVLLRQADDTPQAALLFSGSFPYKIVGEAPSEKLHNLHQLIGNWKGNLETFKEVVFQKFLNQNPLSIDN